MNHMEPTGRDERETQLELERDEEIEMRSDALYIRLYSAVADISKEAALFLSDRIASYADMAAVKEVEAAEARAGEP